MEQNTASTRPLNNTDKSDGKTVRSITICSDSEIQNLDFKQTNSFEEKSVSQPQATDEDKEKKELEESDHPTLPLQATDEDKGKKELEELEYQPLPSLETYTPPLSKAHAKCENALKEGDQENAEHTELNLGQMINEYTTMLEYFNDFHNSYVDSLQKYKEILEESKKETKTNQMGELAPPPAPDPMCVPPPPPPAPSAMCAPPPPTPSTGERIQEQTIDIASIDLSWVDDFGVKENIFVQFHDLEQQKEQNLQDLLKLLFGDKEPHLRERFDMKHLESYINIFRKKINKRIEILMSERNTLQENRRKRRKGKPETEEYRGLSREMIAKIKRVTHLINRIDQTSNFLRNLQPKPYEFRLLKQKDTVVDRLKKEAAEAGRQALVSKTKETGETALAKQEEYENKVREIKSVGKSMVEKRKKMEKFRKQQKIIVGELKAILNSTSNELDTLKEEGKTFIENLKKTEKTNPEKEEGIKVVDDIIQDL